MNVRMRKWLSGQLMLCCILMLVLGAGVNAAGLQGRKNCPEELVSASSESRSMPLSSTPRFVGRQLSLREMQQCFTAHGTEETVKLYELLPENEMPRLDVIPALLRGGRSTLQRVVLAMQTGGLPDSRNLLENIRFERLII